MSKPDEGPQPELIPAPSTRGFLFGLSAAPALAVVLSGLVVILAFQLIGGMQALVVSAPVYIPLLLSAFIPVGDRKLLEWIPIAMAMIQKQITRQDRYRAKILAPRPDGTLALPGRTAALRLVEDAPSGAAFIHDPHRQTLVAVARIEHGEFLLLDDTEKEERSILFSRLISQIASAEGITRTQIISRSIPDVGVGVKTWWEKQRYKAVSPIAAQAYDELTEAVTTATERHETLMVFSLDLRATGRAIKSYGGGLAGAAAIMRARMGTIEGAARTAKLRVSSWLTREELSIMIRTAYDPADAPFLQEHPNLGARTDQAGPVALREKWTMLQTDSAVHKTFLVVWPGIRVWPGFLRPLVVRPGTRIAFTLIFEPIPRKKALAEAKREVINEEIRAHEKAKSGKISTVLDSMDSQKASQNLADVASGFTDVRFAGLITVSAADEHALGEAVEDAKTAAAEANCELRLMYGQQESMFPIAALPLARGLRKKMMI